MDEPTRPATIFAIQPIEPPLFVIAPAIAPITPPTINVQMNPIMYPPLIKNSRKTNLSLLRVTNTCLIVQVVSLLKVTTFV